MIGADILGHVYEQFLGKVIRLTPAHHAKVEEKPEVRKAGGVYYTPTYIVDYIVKNTVGKLCLGTENEADKNVRPTTQEKKGVGKGKKSQKPLTARQVHKLKILDPACGSGSFLIGAYQYLLDYCRDWYAANNPGKHKDKVFRGRGGEWFLTTAEKKRLLLDCIHGVDIDPQAVEVTKLNLLLKALEGESKETLEQQLKLFRERALPDLGGNIKCGNSLIGTDFFDHHQGVLFDDEQLRRINPFDWDTEFPEIMKPAAAGGFDAVIGNPPYGGLFSNIEIQYLISRFQQARKYLDSYCLFIIQSLQLTRSEGLTSLIVPNTFCDLENCDAFRNWLLREYHLDDIWQSGWAFKAAVVDTLVFRIIKRRPEIDAKVQITINGRKYNRILSQFADNDLYKIDYRNTIEQKHILEKVLKRSSELRNLAKVRAGVKMYEKGKGDPPQTEETMKIRPFSKKGECPTGWKSLYRGKDVIRFILAKPKEFVDYGPWLAAPRTPELFESPKILMRRTDDRIMACLEIDSAICVNSCHIIKFKEKYKSLLSYEYLLGLLNSKLMQRIFDIQNPQMVNKVFAEIKVVYVERFPIREIDFNEPKDKLCHDQISRLVDKQLYLNNQLIKLKEPNERIMVQRQIEATDRQIDQLVYELYGLTDEEITIVETETGK